MKKDRLIYGNKKVEAWTFSLPPVKACLNSEACAKTCYAKKAYRQYKQTRTAWDDNLKLATEDIAQLEKDLAQQLKRIAKSRGKRTKIVRIHQSGDFISPEYTMMWFKLANSFPDIYFYGYTKVDAIFPLEISMLDACENVNIIPSFIGGYLNYGDEKHVDMMQEKFGSFVCPAVKDGTIKCGKHCSYCIFIGKNVVFPAH
jgi:hypothetical protein